MNTQICKCCGQPLGELEKSISAHPNICVECSTADEVTQPVNPPHAPGSTPAPPAKQDNPGPVAFAT